MAYIPRNNSIIGLSKLSRLIHALSRSLTTPRQLATTARSTLHHHLNPLGVTVVMQTTEFCTPTAPNFNPLKSRVVYTADGVFAD